MTKKHECKVGTEELLLAYQANRLGPDETIRLERHLDSGDCMECQAFLASQREVWQALDAWSQRAPALSPNFDQLLYARIAEESAGSWWRRTWRRWFQAGDLMNWRPVAAMAMAAVVVTAGIGWRMGENAARRPEAGTKMARVEKAPVIPAGFDAQEMEVIERTLEDFEMINKMGAPAQDLAPAASGNL
jgi:hypothetical protein